MTKTSQLMNKHILIASLLAIFMLYGCKKEPEPSTDPVNPAVYNVQVNTNNANLGTATIIPLDSTYTEGDTIVLTATPADGAIFLNWNGDITENPYTYVVKENITFTANFAQPIYLLNEGSWGGNDAEISLLDRYSNHVTLDWFSRNNGRGLGDLAQDLVHYGSYLYTTVFNSNTIEVINPLTGKSIKQINMGQRGPRYIVPLNGKIYVTCYDKTVVRIDTATFAIEATCPLSGMQPEQLCVIGDNLYVCNCWQYDANGEAIYDSTVSIVNLGTFTETGKITVGQNPGKIKALDSHRFIVACAGDHLSPTTVIVDILSQEKTPLSVSATNFDIYNNTIYLYNTSYDAQWNPTASFYRVDATTLQVTPMLESYSRKLSYAYGINIDPATGNLYVCNSPYTASADVYAFRPDGTEIRHVEGCILSSKVVF